MTVTSTKPKAPRITWRAGVDRIAHAHTRPPWTLCGLAAVAEPLAWPELRRCLGCRNLADQLGAT